jgi:hypothetical protein
MEGSIRKWMSQHCFPGLELLPLKSRFLGVSLEVCSLGTISRPSNTHFFALASCRAIFLSDLPGLARMLIH